MDTDLTKVKEILLARGNVKSRVMVGEVAVTPGGKLVKCKGCGHFIKFGKTEDDKWVAYDPPELLVNEGRATAHMDTCEMLKGAR